MNLIFVGPQASGKGTQGELIAKKLGLGHVSSGDILRSQKGELKVLADKVMAQGALLPTDMMLKMVLERVKFPDCKKGVIFDGFPRNLEQAKALDKVMKIDNVIEIHISDDEAVKRLGGRLTCLKCGAVFNENSNPPKKKGICDACGGKLIKRADDVEEAIRKRLSIYHNETEPILKHYKVIKINGAQAIDRVEGDILRALGKN
jgi:adenylate kinase